MRKAMSYGGPDTGVVRVAVRHQPGEGEDADADDAADADRGELPQPEALVELAYAALGLDLLDLVDGEAPQDRTGLVCTHVCPSVLTPEWTAELTARTRARSFDTWRIEI